MAAQTAAPGAGGGPLGFIRNMPRNQQMILLGAVAVVIVIGLVVAMGGGRREESYVAVWTRLTPRDAGELTTKLQEAKIPYKLMEGGTAVAVPKNQADAALVAMAMKGVPKDGVVGNEIFDKQNFLSTDFEKRVNAQRAMEGELTRLIRKFDGIEDASVKVVVPEPQLFAEQQKPTTAAVMVRFAPGRDWKGGQVEAITHLIASSVPGLPAGHVTVVDASGVVLSKGVGADDPLSREEQTTKILDEQIQFKKKWERDLELRVMDMLDKLVGPNQSRAQVILDIDFSRKQMRDNKVAPFMGPDGQPVPMAQRYGYELSTMPGGGQGAPPGTASQQGGTQQAPPYQAVGQAGTQQTTAGGGSSAEKRTLQSQNMFNKTEELVQAAPGVIKRLSATVLVSEKWPEDRQKDLEAMVKAALGADATPPRNDNVVVQRVKWDTTLEDELKKKMKAGAAVNYTLYYILGGLGAVVLLALLLRPKKKEEEAPPLPPLAIPAAPPPPAMPGAEAAVAGLAGAIGTYTNVPPPGVPMPGAEEPGLALPPEGMAVARAVAMESPFDFLLGIPAETVAQLLSGERLPTLVAVIAQLSPQQAEQVITRLSPEVQDEVRSRLASNPVLPPMTQKMVSQSLKKRLAAMSASRA